VNPSLPIIGIHKPLIAACTLLGLPGRPRHDGPGGMDRIYDAMAPDVEILQRADVDLLMFVNEHDTPYSQTVGMEAAAAMAAIIGRLRANLSRPFGIDMLWDAKAGLAVARATGAAFVRGVFTGAYDGDVGLLSRDWGELAGYRHMISADGVAVFTNITPEYACSVGNRPIADRARAAMAQGIDGLLVSGGYIGVAPDRATMLLIKDAAPDIPLIATSGVVPETIADVLAVADGAVVGSAMRQDGSVWKPVDPDRTRRMVELALRAREDAQVAG
jgi:membrane complex biogenesis BtpA family protein